MGNEEKEVLVKAVMAQVVNKLTVPEAVHVMKSMGAEHHKTHTDNGWIDYYDIVIEGVGVRYITTDGSIS